MIYILNYIRIEGIQGEIIELICNLEFSLGIEAMQTIFRLLPSPLFASSPFGLGDSLQRHRLDPSLHFSLDLYHYYDLVRPCGMHRYSVSCGYCPLVYAPFTSFRQIPTFHIRSQINLPPSICRLVRKQIPANLVPRLSDYLGFDAHLSVFDTSSMVHLRLALRLTPDRFLHLPFPITLTTTPL